MTLPAIEIEDVSKRYYLGTGMHGNLSQALEAMVRAPVRRLLHRPEEKTSEEEEFWALRNVSLSMKPGTVTGLIGANGAGKSTLLKMLARITPPTSGRITMRGNIGSLLEVGTGFHPELTGRENIFLNGAILGMGRQEIFRRYDEIVEFSGIERFIETPVKRYSSGMYVRLAFAVAAYLDTDILLLDEVLAVGDAEFSRRGLNKIDDAAEKGRTVVFVSHDLSSVQRLCDTCAWIDDGRVREFGPTQDVASSYLSEVTATPAGGETVLADDVPRTNNIPGAETRRVSMRDEHGQPISELHLGQPFRIDVTIEVDKPIYDVAVEVGISSMTGNRVVTVQNIDATRPSFDFQPGIHEISAEVDTVLLPGDFTIDIGIHSCTEMASYDYVQRVLIFKALNVAIDSADHYPWGVIRGSVRAGSEWSIRPLLPGEAPASPSHSV